jgi:cytidylate kinase
MMSRRRSIEQIVEDQVKKWGFEHKPPSAQTHPITVVTVSREPGSGGRLIASGIAECLGFDLFHQEVIHELAQSAHVSKRIIESLDEKGLSMLEDWVAASVHKHFLWPDEYLQLLLKVIGTIGRHGNAVLVGRGANFVLAPESTFRLRIIASKAFRAQKVAETFDIPVKEAERRILKTESDRRAFVQKYYHKNIEDPTYYDMVINTDHIPLEEAIECVCHVIKRTQGPSR